MTYGRALDFDLSWEPRISKHVSLYDCGSHTRVPGSNGESLNPANAATRKPVIAIVNGKEIFCKSLLEAATYLDFEKSNDVSRMIRRGSKRLNGDWARWPTQEEIERNKAIGERL